MINYNGKGYYTVEVAVLSKGKRSYDVPKFIFAR